MSGLNASRGWWREMKPVFVLNARDEAAVVERWVENVAPLAHAAVLVDTGSEDDTVANFRDACNRLELSNFIFCRTWVDFAHNQTLLLELASNAFPDRYLWNLDADEMVVPEGSYHPPEPGQDGFKVCRLYAETYEVWGVRVFWAGSGWRYVGERHAVPDQTGKRVARLEGVHVINRRDGARGKAMNPKEQTARFERDAGLFRAKLEADNGDTRSAYYLAQSLKDAGLWLDAIEAYGARAAMPGGFAEERYLSLFEKAKLLRLTGASDGDVETAYRAAIADRPFRNEARVELCKLLRSAGRWRECYELAFDAAMVEKPADLFLVERDSYGWKPLFELALASLRLEHSQSRQLHETLLVMPTLPAPEKRLVEQNLQRHFSAQSVG